MKLALATAIYPSVTKYIGDFFNSARNQTNKDFDLWIGLDGVSENEVLKKTNNLSNIHFLKAPMNVTPAGVRNMVLEQVLPAYNAVALVDSDDILDETRVEAAKKHVAHSDVTATGMDYIDGEGKRIEGFFDPGLGDPSLIANNVFGFSNTTWRSVVLAQFIPVPDNCALMDWYFATLAFYSGASLCYDNEPRMLYRQHPGNIAASRPPFTTGQIIKATDLVLAHYDLVLAAFAEKGIAGSEKFEQARQRVKRFGQAIQNQTSLEQYVAELNSLPDRHVWWSCVAHPDLEGLWGR